MRTIIRRILRMPAGTCPKCGGYSSSGGLCYSCRTSK